MQSPSYANGPSTAACPVTTFPFNLGIGKRRKTPPVETHLDYKGIDGKAVLVVEDEPAGEIVLMATLSDVGYRALDAVDKSGGLAVLQS